MKSFVSLQPVTCTEVSSNGCEEPYPAAWNSLPQDLLLAIFSHLSISETLNARATSSAWKDIFDHRVRCARGNLRDPKLPPLPSACSAVQRVELSFGASSACTTCIFGSDAEDAARARYALARLKLGATGASEAQDMRRELVLHFTNFLITAKQVEDLLTSSPGIFKAWPQVRVMARPHPNLWPGQPVCGLVLDGSLGEHLVCADMAGGWACGTIWTHVYPQLETLTLGAQGTSLSSPGWPALLLQPHTSFTGSLLSSQLWSLVDGGGVGAAAAVAGGTSGSSTAAAAALPGLRVLCLEGVPANWGVGSKAGSFLRPEGVALAGLPPSLQELRFVRAEMPRVYASSAHAKPWEAVLLVELVDYLTQHFLAPCAAALPELSTVCCLEVRVPQGQLIRCDPAADRGGSAGPLAGAAGAGGTANLEGQPQGDRAGAGGKDRVCGVYGTRVVEVPGCVAATPAGGSAWWMGARAARGAAARAVSRWHVSVSERMPLPQAALDGLDVEVCDVVFCKVNA